MQNGSSRLENIALRYQRLGFLRKSIEDCVIIFKILYKYIFRSFRTSSHRAFFTRWWTLRIWVWGRDGEIMAKQRRHQLRPLALCQQLSGVTSGDLKVHPTWPYWFRPNFNFLQLRSCTTSTTRSGHVRTCGLDFKSIFDREFTASTPSQHPTVRAQKTQNF